MTKDAINLGNFYIERITQLDTLIASMEERNYYDKETPERVTVKIETKSSSMNWTNFKNLNKTVQKDLLPEGFIKDLEIEIAARVKAKAEKARSKYQEKLANLSGNYIKPETS